MTPVHSLSRFRFALLALLASTRPTPVPAQTVHPSPQAICVNCSTISITGGDNQSASPLTTLPSALTARVVFNFTGQPVVGGLVDFDVKPPANASGTLISAANGLPSGAPTHVRALTDSNGVASAQLTLGDTAGPYPVDASCFGCLGATFHETASAPSPLFSVTDLRLPVSGTQVPVKSPAPVQVVFNPHASAQPASTLAPDPGPFDLVAGKATAFLVGVAVDQVHLVPPQGVEVQLVFGNLPPLPAVFVTPQCASGQTFNCFQSDGTATAVINTGFAPQPAAMGVSVTATVNPAGANHIPESDGSGQGKSASVAVNVKNTSGISLTYLRVLGCGVSNTAACALSAQAPADVAAGNAFIARTYPLPDGATLGSLGPAYITASPGPALLAMWLDIYNLRRATGQFQGPPHPVPHVVGLVPKNYFPSHLLNRTYGVTFGRFSLVAEGTETAAAHELGHQLGLEPFPQEEYLPPNTPPGNPASGFSVAANGLIHGAFCFMGNQLFAAGLTQSGPTWVDNAHFGALFSTLLTTPGDPETLLFGAIVHQNGQIDILPSQRNANGYPDPDTPGGNYAVVVSDASGAVLSRTAVSVIFGSVANADNGQVTALDSALVSVEVPYSPSASTIALFNGALPNGTGPVVQIHVAPKLLADAVTSLSPAAFVSEGVTRRNQILGMVSAFDGYVSRGANNDARRVLESDIAPAIGNWLVPGYVPVSLLEATQAGIQDLIAELAKGL